MSEAKTATLVSALTPDVRKIAEAVKTAATAFGKARDNLSTALYNLAKTDAHTRAGLPFKVFGPRLAAEMGFEVSASHCTNAVKIGTAKAVSPAECKGLGDTVILRSVEALGRGEAFGEDDAEDLSAFLSEVKAAGGRVDDVKAVKAAKAGGSAKVDRETEAVRKAAEALGKVWKDDALGQTAALASVARALGLNAVADTIMMGRDAIAAEAVRKALAKAEPEAKRKAARPSAEAVAEAASRMAEADAKAEAEAKAAPKAKARKAK